MMAMMTVMSRGEVHCEKDYTRTGDSRQEKRSGLPSSIARIPGRGTLREGSESPGTIRPHELLPSPRLFRRNLMHSNIWTHMFVLAIPVAEKILRPLAVYIFLVLGLRLAGKRELAQLNPFDLVVLLTLSNTVQNAIIGDDNSVTGGIIGAATLLLVNYLVVRFLYRHEKIDRFVEGESCPLIENGKVLQDHLLREVLTLQRLE